MEKRLCLYVLLPAILAVAVSAEGAVYYYRNNTSDGLYTTVGNWRDASNNTISALSVTSGNQVDIGNNALITTDISPQPSITVVGDHVTGTLQIGSSLTPTPSPWPRLRQGYVVVGPGGAGTVELYNGRLVSTSSQAINDEPGYGTLNVGMQVGSSWGYTSPAVNSTGTIHLHTDDSGSGGGSELNVNNTRSLVVGRDSHDGGTSVGHVIIDDGFMNVSSNTILGFSANSTGTLEINDGASGAPHQIGGYLDVGGNGAGTFTMNGGELNISGNLILAHFSSSTGHAQLDGGIVRALELQELAGAGTLDITLGELILKAGSATVLPTINSLIASNLITAYGGTGTVQTMVDGSDWVHVTAIPVPEPGCLVLLGLGGILLKRKH